jgi:hypothetical protein
MIEHNTSICATCGFKWNWEAKCFGECDGGETKIVSNDLCPFCKHRKKMKKQKKYFKKVKSKLISEGFCRKKLIAFLSNKT